jgi:hypothetical protein
MCPAPKVAIALILGSASQRAPTLRQPAALREQARSLAAQRSERVEDW